jgi:dCMP deaminase
MSRPSVKDVMLGCAKAHASRSTCGFGKRHGAVIYRNGRILASGYNGPPTGWPDCDGICQLGDKDKLGHDWRKCPAVHAEINAVLGAAMNGVSILGASMVITRSPCMNCLTVMCNSGMEILSWPAGDEWLDVNLLRPHQTLGMWTEYIGGME